MLILQLTTDSFEILLGGAPVTQLPVYASYRDITDTTYTPGRNAVTTNGVTAVAFAPAPAASTRRVIDFVNIFNPNAATAVVTIRLNANATPFILHVVTLAQNERLQYQEASGWTVTTSTGSIKTSLNQGASPVTSTWSQAVLAADVINNNAVANSIADVTGLSFPVVSGTRYEFEARILYSAAATTTGSRWTINGPAFTELVYNSDVPLTVTTETINRGLAAYDLPAAANASSVNTTWNIAILRGFVRPSADGNVQLRFASEIASSAITARAGSRVNYKAL